MLARSFFRFAVVGAIATAIHAAVFAILIEATPIDPVAATVVAFAVAFVANFALNRRWTFASRGEPVAEFLRYLGVQAAGLTLNVALMALAVHVQRWSPYAGLALVVVLVPPVPFSLARAGAFKR